MPIPHLVSSSVSCITTNCQHLKLPDPREDVCPVPAYLFGNSGVVIDTTPTVRWESSMTQPDPAPGGRLDCEALYTAIDAERRRRRIRGHREVLRQAGVPGVNLLSRLGQGAGPDSTNLIRLLLWLGTTDLAPFITTDSEESPNDH
jgi:hypothetical protein